MNKREEVLWKIAELYPELVDPLSGPSGVRGTGESLGFMPAEYTATVREYERLVRLMRDDRGLSLLRLEDGTKVSVRSCWWHLEHYWHRARRVVKRQQVTRPGKRGARVVLLNADRTPVLQPALVWLRDPAADVVRAKRAIQFIADSWDGGRVGEPMLPAAVVEGFKVAA